VVQFLTSEFKDLFEHISDIVEYDRIIGVNMRPIHMSLLSIQVLENDSSIFLEKLRSVDEKSRCVIGVLMTESSRSSKFTQKM
jgi:hypothetical protein